MLEEELRNILNSLSHLSAHGEIPVQTFATLVKGAKIDLLVEHLHQRWLSDHNFGYVAARMMSYIQRDDPNDMKLCSRILSLCLNDYKKRYEMRRNDRKMFRNYCKSLMELLPVFLQIDKYMGNGLIQPLFDCMFMLLDANPDEGDIKCVAQILVRSGHILNNLDPVITDKMVMKSRLAFCSKEPVLNDLTRFTLLNAIDLWTFNWNVQAMPLCLHQFYQEQYEHYNMLEYGGRRWLPFGVRDELSISTSTFAPSSVVSSFSRLTNEPETETVV